MRLEWQDAVQKRLGRRRAAWIAASCLTSAALIALVLHAHVRQAGRRDRAAPSPVGRMRRRTADVQTTWRVFSREQRRPAARSRRAASCAGDLLVGNEMIEDEHDQVMLSRLVGCWKGTLRASRVEAEAVPAVARHVGEPVGARRPVRRDDAPRRHGRRQLVGGVLHRLRAQRAALRAGLARAGRPPGHARAWAGGRSMANRLVLTSQQSRVVCDMATPGS